MSNILRAINNILQLDEYNVDEVSNSYNRMNSMGSALESFITDSFCNSFTLDEMDKIREHEKVFSYLGNDTNPPDMMIREGVAIEVKKLKSHGRVIQLNSSHPKSKLFSDSSMITRHCKECEDWTEKELFYVIGIVTKRSIEALFFVQGSLYCADNDLYEGLKTKIRDEISSIPNINFSETVELGRVNNVDPLGITSLRIRGMWLIQNPYSVFNYLYQFDNSKSFQLICLMTKEHFDNTDETDKDNLTNNDIISIRDVVVRDPNNKANPIDSKLINI